MELENKKNSRNKNKKRVVEVHVTNPSKLDLPSQNILSQPVSRAHRRFNLVGAGTTNVFNTADGHGQFLVVVAVTGNAVPWVDMWRMRKIKIWNSNRSNDVVLTALSQSTVQNGVNSRERTVCAQRALGDTQPTVCEITPTGPSDPLGFWYETSTLNSGQNLFTVTTTALTDVVMDIWFDYIVNVVGVANGYAIVTTTSSLGTLGAIQPVGGKFRPANINVL